MALTLGEKGALVQKEGGLAFCAGFDVEAIDTTGAGDTFAGYYLAERMKGKQIEEALKTACAAAALAVVKEGTISAIPIYAYVQNFLKNTSEKRQVVFHSQKVDAVRTIG